MANEELTALAAECEARAEAGEKPEHPGWKSHPLSSIVYLDEGRLASIIGMGDSFDVAIATKHRAYMSSLIAGQLFAEAFLREATAPLHAARIAALEARIAELESQVSSRKIMKVMENKRLLGEALATPVVPQRIPEGATPVGGWLLDGTYYIAGDPDEETDPDHNCDAMGCGQCHIVDHAKSIASLESPRLRPMSEAPRDGTKMFALKHFGTEWAVVHMFRDQWVSSGLGFQDRDFAGWLPLPAPDGTK